MYYKKNNSNDYIGGIYMIVNKINNKKYIGQTYDFKYKFKSHIYELNKNNHPNKYLQRSWNKYGQNNFIFKIIEECKEDIIDKREIYWINYYNTTNRNLGYNLCDGGSGCHGFKHTEEQLNKMRKVKNPKRVDHMI